MGQSRLFLDYLLSQKISVGSYPSLLPCTFYESFVPARRAQGQTNDLGGPSRVTSLREMLLYRSIFSAPQTNIPGRGKSSPKTKGAPCPEDRVDSKKIYSAMKFYVCTGTGRREGGRKGRDRQRKRTFVVQASLDSLSSNNPLASSLPSC